MLSLLHRSKINSKNIKKKERSWEIYGLSLLSSLSQSAADVRMTSKVSSPQILAAVPLMKCVGCVIGSIW